MIGMVRPVLGAFVLLLSAQSPVLADWKYYELTNGSGGGVHQQDTTGNYLLDIGCDSVYGEKTFSVAVGLDDVVELVVEDEIPVTVIVDGKSFDPIDTELNIGSLATIEAWEDDDGRVGDVVAAIAQASDTVSVQFLGNTVSFEMSGMDAVRGEFESYCP